jgi:chlorite dismutase
MKVFDKIIKIFSQKKEVECEKNHYCPIYLSYAHKYGEKSAEVNLCKNPNKQYCKRYKLVDQTKWQLLSTDERLKIVAEMHLIDFVEKEYRKI